jgi:hypothetical protein
LFSQETLIKTLLQQKPPNIEQEKLVNLLSKKLLLSGVVLSVLLCSSLVPLAGASTIWSQTYGGSGTDCAHSLVATSNGGYALAGSTSSSGAGQDDFWLVKIDESGNVEWNQTYGGKSFDYAYSLAATSDGGYALAGGDLLVKTDAFGNMQWSKTYEQGSVHSLIAMSDGGYILAGAWNYSGDCDFWLVKTDPDGVMEWNRTYGGLANDYACSVVAASGGGYAIAGATNGDFWLVKTDEDGNMEWSQTYGGAGDDIACSLVAASDGGYAIAGVWGCDNDLWKLYALSSGGDAWLVKTDALGNMQWNKTYGGTGADWAASLVETPDGGYAIAGTFNCTMFIVSGGGDYWLVKTDAFGNLEWSGTYGGERAEATSCLVEAPDGGYVIAGCGPSSDHKSFDFLLVKTDEFGFSSKPSSRLPSLILLLTGASLVVASILSILIKRRKLCKRSVEEADVKLTQCVGL